LRNTALEREKNLPQKIATKGKKNELVPINESPSFTPYV